MPRSRLIKSGTRIALLIAALSFISARLLAAAPSVEHDTAKKLVTLADAERNLVLRLNYDGKCVLDKVSVRGRDVVPETAGVCSGVKVADQSRLRQIQGEGVENEIARRFGGTNRSAPATLGSCYAQPPRVALQHRPMWSTQSCARSPALNSPWNC